MIDKVSEVVGKLSDPLSDIRPDPKYVPEKIEPIHILPDIVDIPHQRMQDSLFELAYGGDTLKLIRDECSGLEDAITIYALRYLSPDEIDILIRHAINKSCNNIAINSQYQSKKLSPTEREEKSKLLKVMLEEANKINRDREYVHQYGKKWLSKEGENLSQIKKELYDFVASVDASLNSLFAPYLQARWRSIKDRILVASELEYVTCAESIGMSRHNAHVFVGGIAVPSDIEGLGIAVIPVRAHLALSYKDDQMSPICVYDSEETKKAIRHEAIHLSPLTKIEKTDEGEYKIQVKKGFKTTKISAQEFSDKSLTENAGITQVEVENTGLEEGATVFIETFEACDRNLEKTLQTLDSFDPTSGPVSEGEYGYAVMARMTGKLVREVGLPIFLDAYVNSDLEKWRSAVEAKLGKDYFEEYAQSGKRLIEDAEDKIRNSE